MFFLGEANGSGYTCWIWDESFGWCYRKYYWQGAHSTLLITLMLCYNAHYHCPSSHWGDPWPVFVHCNDMCTLLKYYSSDLWSVFFRPLRKLIQNMTERLTRKSGEALFCGIHPFWKTWPFNTWSKFWI